MSLVLEHAFVNYHSEDLFHLGTNNLIVSGNEVPIQMTNGYEANFKGVIDLIGQKVVIWNEDKCGYGPRIRRFLHRNWQALWETGYCI